MTENGPDTPADEHAGNAAAPAGNADSGITVEVKPSVEEQLVLATQKAQEHLESWLRAKAETENLRKRAQADIASAHKYGVENLAEALLPVRDSLEAALAVENTTLESLRSGVELTLKQLKAVFEKANLKEINPVNEKFDPHRHQAMTMVTRPGEPNQVVEVMQKGYLLHDRVVRPALVTVSKAPDA
ncbi:MAG: nucleotide exchange factor GrpE [Betaproteobacteria bacterium]|nr:MAG: nucleotide exchange factor GrpE [Betaproteobacteria bacterium]